MSATGRGTLTTTLPCSGRAPPAVLAKNAAVGQNRRQPVRARPTSIDRSGPPAAAGSRSHHNLNVGSTQRVLDQPGWRRVRYKDVHGVKRREPGQRVAQHFLVRGNHYYLFSGVHKCDLGGALHIPFNVERLIVDAADPDERRPRSEALRRR